MDETDGEGASELGLESGEDVDSAGRDIDSAVPEATPESSGAARPTPPRRRPLIIGAVAVVVVAAAVAVGVIATSSGPSAPGAGVAPADFVVSSTQTTLDQRSADMTITGTIVVAGQHVPMQGSGFANFSTNQFSANIDIAKGSTSVVEHEIVSAGQFFFGLDYDGVSMSAITGGPHWVSVPVPDQGSSSQAAPDLDPQSQLQLLAKKGATVQPLGASTVNGITVSGYAVTPSRAEELQRIRDEISSGAIPPQLAQQALASLKFLGNLTTDVYFDQSGLLRKQTVQIAGGTSGASSNVVMTFSSYGTPGTIATPAASDVVSLSQFEKDATALGGATHA